MADILNKESAVEYREILNRMSNGKWAKAKAGFWMGGKVPYGYYSDEDHRYQIDPVESVVYEDMVRWSEEGTPLRQIIARLKAAGIRAPRQGQTWAISSVYSILHSSLYTGVYLHFDKHHTKDKRGKPTAAELHVVTPLPPLITHERWERLQEIMSSRKTMSPRNQKRDYLLSKLLFCGHCHGHMTGEYQATSAAEDKRVYSCHKHRNLGTPCPTAYVKADAIEGVVWGMVVSSVQNVAQLRQSTEAALQVRPSKPISNLIAQLEVKEREDERLVDLYVSGGLDKVDLEQRRKRNHEQQQLLKENMAEIKQQWKVQDKLTGFNSIVQLLQQHARHLRQAPYAVRRQVLEWLFYGGPDVGIYHHLGGRIELRYWYHTPDSFSEVPQRA